MASTCFLARVSLLHALLLAKPPPHAITCRLRHGAVAAAARTTLGSVRYSTGAAVPPSVPVRVAYELQLAGHRYLDVRTEGEFGGGHPAGAVNIPYMYSTGSGMSKNSQFLDQVSETVNDHDGEDPSSVDQPVPHTTTVDHPTTDSTEDQGREKGKGLAGRPRRNTRLPARLAGHEWAQ